MRRRVAVHVRLGLGERLGRSSSLRSAELDSDVLDHPRAGVPEHRRKPAFFDFAAEGQGEGELAKQPVGPSLGLHAPGREERLNLEDEGNIELACAPLEDEPERIAPLEQLVGEDLPGVLVAVRQQLAFSGDVGGKLAAHFEPLEPGAPPGEGEPVGEDVKWFSRLELEHESSFPPADEGRREARSFAREERDAAQRCGERPAEALLASV